MNRKERILHRIVDIVVECCRTRISEDGYSVAKEQVDELLKRFGVQLEDKNGYDYVYAANMCKADYLQGSVPDESHLALNIKETIDDPDAGDGELMRCWYAKTVARGIVVDWEDLV